MKRFMFMNLFASVNLFKIVTWFAHNTQIWWTYEPCFDKGFTIVDLFVGWFLCGPFVQQTNIHEPILTFVNQLLWTDAL